MARVRLRVADPRAAARGTTCRPHWGDPTATNHGAGIARNEVTSAATTGPRARSTAAIPRTTVLARCRRRSVASTAADGQVTGQRDGRGTGAAGHVERHRADHAHPSTFREP